MSINQSKLERIKQIAEALGCKHNKEHLIHRHEQVSAPYLVFLQSMARNALLVTSFASNLSHRLTNLQTFETNLVQSGYKLIGNSSGDNLLNLELDDCKALSEIINYHVEMEKDAQKALNNMFLTSIVSCFEVYIQDLLYEIFIHYPNTLRCNKTLTSDEIIKYSSMDELISQMAQIEASKSTDGSAVEYLTRMAKKFGFNKIEELINQGIIQGGIEKISGIRNVIVHSGGVVDAAYLRRYPQSSFQEGDSIKVNLQDMASISENIRLTVGIIESLVTQKFGDIAVTEWSTQSDMHLEYILDLENYAV
ncbi:hypothetical protein [uncultured Nostoc sp.]|uniref:hypothetical protein n=1 Tax=uncultured Nostoc sp. TaxID=340711 RepID=UPI0035CA19B7